MADPLLVLGIGNDYRGDDAAGLLAARRLLSLSRPDIRVVVVAGDMLQALEELDGAGRLVIIDAVLTGKAPGTIHWIDLRSPLPTSLRSASTHSMSIASAIELARTLGTLPADAVLAGIEAGDCSVGSSPCGAVREAVERVVGKILEWAISGILESQRSQRSDTAGSDPGTRALNPRVKNTADMRDRRRELRRSQTVAEAALWERLRARRLGGYKFFRQYSQGPYILDFYCPESRLAIELDGSQHMEEGTAKYDAARTRYLEGFGIRVLRFWNNEALGQLDAVVEAIHAAASSAGAGSPHR